MGEIFLVTAGYDAAIRFWEAPSGTVYRTISYTDSQVNKLCISPNNEQLAVAGNQKIRIFNIASKDFFEEITLSGHTNNVTGIGYDQTSSWLYSCSEDCSVKIWDFRTEKFQHEVHDKHFVNAAELHPNQAEIVFGNQNGDITIWDLAAGKKTKSFVLCPDDALRSISITPDAKRMAAVTNSGTCYTWELARTGLMDTDLSKYSEHKAHDVHVLKCLYSKDGKILATTSADHTVRLWDAETMSLDKTLSGHSRWVWDCAFSSDSKYLVTASSDASARLWDLQSGETIRQYSGNKKEKAMVAIALSDAGSA